MKTTLVILTGCIFSLAQIAHAAQAGCSALPDDEELQGDTIVALQSQVGDGELLQIDFEEAQVCIIERGSHELEGQAVTAMHVNARSDEIAIQATIDGVDVWLRVDGSYSDAMVLDRAISEELGLTDGEFLGDNSLLEASDFFVEYIYALGLGEFEVRDVEANIPRLDAAYDHYAGRPAPSGTDMEFVTVGSVGEALLEGLLITFDFSNERIYTTKAR